MRQIPDFQNLALIGREKGDVREFDMQFQNTK